MPIFNSFQESKKKLEDERQKIIEEPANSEPYVEEEDSLDFVRNYILLGRKWLVDAGILSPTITLKENSEFLVPSKPKL